MIDFILHCFHKGEIHKTFQIMIDEKYGEIHEIPCPTMKSMANTVSHLQVHTYDRI